MMFFNTVGEKLGENRLRDIVRQWTIAIDPIGYAFAIWGVIYLFIMAFVIYAVLPNSWVPSRNNELIFGQCGWLIIINFTFNALWLIVFKYSTPIAFIIAFGIIGVMESSGLLIIQYASYAELNTFEAITLRAGFTIYIAWVSAATILGATYVLYSSGLQSN
jgi:hypothetical protein